MLSYNTGYALLLHLKTIADAFVWNLYSYRILKAMEEGREMNAYGTMCQILSFPCMLGNPGNNSAEEGEWESVTQMPFRSQEMCS